MRISDWSSDVCSSDLNLRQQVTLEDAQRVVRCIGVTRQLLHGQRIRFEQRRMWVLALQKAHQQLVEVPAVEDALTAEQQRRRSEEHTSELQSLMRISYAVFCLKKNKESHVNSILIQEQKPR